MRRRIDDKGWFLSGVYPVSLDFEPLWEWCRNNDPHDWVGVPSPEDEIMSRLEGTLRTDRIPSGAPREPTMKAT